MRIPRRTARMRLTILYGVTFLACGAAVLALTFLLYGGTVHVPGFTARPVIHGMLRAPISQVRREGDYDVVTIPVSTRQASSGLGQLASQRQSVLIDSAVTLAVFAVAAAVIGWLLAGRVLRPLSTITAAAQRISASRLHERLGLHGPDDELKELADTLDGLFARLEAAFDAQQRFAANASHELRTPLTRERALLQVALADPAATTGTWRDVGRVLLGSNTEQEHLIEALLTLAGGETGTGDREPTDLAAITTAALDAARPAIGGLGLLTRTDVRPAVIDGDPLLVRQLVTNLIDNAVRHNVPGGDIRITTGAGGGHVTLSVTGSGPVIPAEEVDRLFQPFQRLGPRSARRDGGHGLGLSIVRAIASAHGATVEGRAVPAGGLMVDVSFPLPTRPESVPSRQ